MWSLLKWLRISKLLSNFTYCLLSSIPLIFFISLKPFCFCPSPLYLNSLFLYSLNLYQILALNLFSFCPSFLSSFPPPWLSSPVSLLVSISVLTLFSLFYYHHFVLLLLLYLIFLVLISNCYPSLFTVFNLSASLHFL